jgi:dethiobiotin synthetase
VEELGDRRSLLLIYPLLLEGSEEVLVELTHKAEARPLVEEVKLLVILIVGSLGFFLGH